MQDASIQLTGIVQGVGMRPFVYREAVAHGIAGWVLNASDGVHIEAHAGSDAALDGFVRALREHAPAAARIDEIRVEELPASKASGTPDTRRHADGPAVASPASPAFRILSSHGDGARTTLVSPDIATCPDCLRELFDPADRRYHYPFINCTNCGPRFTIIRSLPYDRPATSMDRFPMCPDCAREYTDPADRRFHAQPDACFTCGPHITWREHGDTQAGSPATPATGQTREESDAIIGRCADLLAAGGIVAIKGLGGFHLACSAADEDAVRELRRRKRRSNKPLAVMMRVEDIDDILTGYANGDGNAADLLCGTVRPIVLMRRFAQESCPDIAPSVAFDLPETGVMTPYTPLQHLLLAACAARGVRALVMTSGNLSEEPIETDDDEAWSRLGSISDALLGNDRPILARYDDSVVRATPRGTMVVRRARGYAPQPLGLPALPNAHAVPPAILACGAEQKATLAFTREDKSGGARCFVTQHIGDVENASTLTAWHDARTRFEQLFDLLPAALACDLHPTYLPSQWARRTARARGLPLVEVQHHHAHIAAVIAEATCAGRTDPDQPVIGIAFDGTGAGPDGTIWGGEVLAASLRNFKRIAHLRTWRLPGGTAAVRDARRNAYALLNELGLLDHPGAAGLVASLDTALRDGIETMLAHGINSPRTSSAGRLFDAVSALLGICGTATYEGEPACELEAAAWTTTAGCTALFFADLPHAVVTDDPADGSCVLDPSPLLRDLLDGMARGDDPALLAMAFHHAMAQLVRDAAKLAREQTGLDTVALSGGVFMNRTLLDQSVRLLEDAGFTVLIPYDIPINDGCIAYGQAAVARARFAAGDEPAA